jgi:benzoyl-CoA reductase/2-hydroxyglutaryl-CoA dehydratase subunit BcrC/BadD/HgdB
MRESYVREQAQSHGRLALVVLPIHYPREILTALNILGVELWGPPGPPRGPAAGRVQTYVCPVVRNATAFLEAGGASVCGGALFPHTCDSIQGLATLAADFGVYDKPCFTYMHPKGEDRPSARAFVRHELRTLAERLSAWAGRSMTDEALSRAVALHRRIDAARATLLDRRACLPMDDTALYALLRRGEWLWPEDHLAELEPAVAALQAEPVQKGVPLMVTGYVPEPSAVLEQLGDAGAFVVADDYAAIGRRVVTPRGPLPADPWDALVELSFAAPPCSTRSASQSRRVDRLARLAVTSGARGLVMHMMKFCEPELFDLPAIRRRFEMLGVPVLVLESELERELSGQAMTRLEAFVEMVERREAA